MFFKIFFFVSREINICICEEHFWSELKIWLNIKFILFQFFHIEVFNEHYYILIAGLIYCCLKIWICVDVSFVLSKFCGSTSPWATLHWSVSLLLWKSWLYRLGIRWKWKMENNWKNTWNLFTMWKTVKPKI